MFRSDYNLCYCVFSEGIYTNQNQIEHRRNSFNNNKVLVGGDHKHENTHANQPDGPHSAPVMPLVSNPFDKMPSNLKFTTPPEFPEPNMPPPKFQIYVEKVSKNQPFNDFEAYNSAKFQPNNFPDSPNLPNNLPNNFPDAANLPNNFPDPATLTNNFPVSPNFERPKNVPYDPSLVVDVKEMVGVFEDERNDLELDRQDVGKSDWNPRHRFPRNWGPRTNFRPPGQFAPQFRSRNGPRPNGPRWMGPRRFW